jgi:signal transduction histidine kinase
VSVIVDHDRVCLTALVEDDGRGFSTTAVDTTGHLGLLGMSERAALVGGVLHVESSPGAGTTIRVRIPAADTPGAANP